MRILAIPLFFTVILNCVTPKSSDQTGNNTTVAETGALKESEVKYVTLPGAMAIKQSDVTKMEVIHEKCPDQNQQIDNDGDENPQIEVGLSKSVGKNHTDQKVRLHVRYGCKNN